MEIHDLEEAAKKERQAYVEKMRERFYQQYGQQAVRVLAFLRNSPEAEGLGLWAELDGLLWMWAQERANEQ